MLLLAVGMAGRAASRAARPAVRLSMVKTMAHDARLEPV